MLKDLTNLEKNPLTNENIKKRNIDLKSRQMNLPRGISLFVEIPDERTCDSAGIESHWCTCYERLELSTSDHRVQR